MNRKNASLYVWLEKYNKKWFIEIRSKLEDKTKGEIRSLKDL
jgi:hypothetical protein